MLFSKSCRMVLAMAAAGALAEVVEAGCNCSVPPSPAASAGVAPASPMMGNPAYGYSPGSAASTAWGTYTNPHVPYNPDGPYWAPGGYEPRGGSPVFFHDPAHGQYVTTGNTYVDHFGPGFHRQDLYGHYRFPYYNYRAPWYFPGTNVYNRDTNFPW